MSNTWATACFPLDTVQAPGKESGAGGKGKDTASKCEVEKSI
jgi:hypothetical protein